MRNPVNTVVVPEVDLANVSALIKELLGRGRKVHSNGISALIGFNNPGVKVAPPHSFAAIVSMCNGLSGVPITFADLCHRLECDPTANLAIQAEVEKMAKARVLKVIPTGGKPDLIEITAYGIKLYAYRAADSGTVTPTS
jgi:hypothetical protein